MGATRLVLETENLPFILIVASGLPSAFAEHDAAHKLLA
jgi:hypothetical protein